MHLLGVHAQQGPPAPSRSTEGGHTRACSRRCGHGDVDAEKALRGRDAFANGWDDYWQVKWVESVEAGLIRGHARITG
jgi:hypothetical protein